MQWCPYRLILQDGAVAMSIRACVPIAARKCSDTSPVSDIDRATSVAVLCVAAVEEFLQLRREMKSWVGVPRAVRTALTPEATVKHAEKMLPKDCRMRIFWPKGSQHGAMYLCHQAHVDLANSSSGGTSLLFQSHGPSQRHMLASICVYVQLP